MKESIARILVVIVLLFVPVRSVRRKLRNRWLEKYKKTFGDFVPIPKAELKIVFPHEIDCPEMFSMPLCTQSPLVSIIIPVYNQYSYTKLCLWSILKNTEGIDYEIVIADDASNDETKSIRDRISNITVERNAVNKGFLHNCNGVVKTTRGKYIVLLNNDTQVQKKWLNHLLETIENTEDVGMVGSKIIMPDNLLQEAGGIVFNNGQAAQYARGEYFDVSEASYVKEVDYISGCAVMLRREDWDKLGGFDPRYEPAYYEDTDLAFSVREVLGKKVIFQPLSIVMHMEGTTCGTDTSQGIKSYQIINQKKFLEKWQKILKEKHSNTEDIFHARDRSLHKKTLLFVDYGILHYDMDAGSRASFQYLKYFVQEGYNVKFLPVFKTGWDKNYIDSHLQLGVEIINNICFLDWIREFGAQVDYVYLNRPDVSKEVIDILKANSRAKLIYQGHDMHYLRLQRRYEQTQDKTHLDESLKFKKIESDIFSAVDVACMFSKTETDIINVINPSLATAVLPLFILNSKVMKSIVYEASERKNIMFIGSFGHAPNIDAINWFVSEVFPSVLKCIPEMIFYIIGSEPPKEVHSLQSENIKILGMVSEEELNEIYSSVKMSVIPLRFGAGVKGKVIEAIFNKVPVLTTSIGAEGIKDDEGILSIADTVSDFARKLVDMYTNDAMLNSISSKSVNMIEKEFSTEAVRLAFGNHIKSKL